MLKASLDHYEQLKLMEDMLKEDAQAKKVQTCKLQDGLGEGVHRVSNCPTVRETVDSKFPTVPLFLYFVPPFSVLILCFLICPLILAINIFQGVFRP